MLCTKKVSTVLIATLLVLMLSIPVYADTNVSVTTTGNVTLIVETDGTITIIYNGVNIQQMINGLGSALNSIAGKMSSLATETDLDEVNQTVYFLIDELEAVLDNLYARTNYLAAVIGLNSNSSTVLENLKNGTSTVSGYLDSILTDLDLVTEDITILNTEISSVYAEFQEFESKADADNTEIQKAINRLQAGLQTEIQNLQTEIDEIYADLDGKRQVLVNATVADLENLSRMIEEEKLYQTSTDGEVRSLEDILLDVQTKLYHYEIVIYLLAIGVILAIVLVIYVAGKKSKSASS